MEQSASRGGWKIKERRTPAESKPEHPGAKNSDQLDSSETKSTDAAERKLIIGASPLLKTGHLPTSKTRPSYSRWIIPSALLLITLLVTAAAFYAPFLGHVERWLGLTLPWGNPDQTNVSDHQDETTAIAPALNQDMSVRAIALPALEDEGQLLVYFRLPAPVEWPIEVAYETEAHTAEADTDFTPTAGVATIEPGDTLVELSIPLIDDDVVEPPEMFRVTLSVDPEAASLADPQLTATVLDDDSRKQENKQ